VSDTWTAPAQRIVSLLPSATEIAYALGLDDRLVGVTHECDFPLRAREKPQLTSSALPAAASSAQIDRHVRRSLHEGSSLYALDSALLERLNPDLIVTQELCEVCAVSYAIVARAARRVRSDPRVVSLEPSSLEDVFANILTVGELTGTAERARAVIAELRLRVDALRAHVAGRRRPRTLVLAGGEPLLAHPGANSQVLGWEAILAASPEVILVAPCGYDLDATLRAVAELAALELWQRLASDETVRIYALDGNAYVNRPGPRLVDTAELFASAIGGQPYGAGSTDRRALQRLG
jgi:iron complex transport system substrate-binding protein